MRHPIAFIIIKLENLILGVKRRYYNYVAKHTIRSNKYSSFGSNCHFFGKTIFKIDRESKGLIIGDNFICRSGKEYGVGVKASKIQIARGAHLLIGNNTGMSNSIIACCSEIIIGDNVNIGFETTIIDTDFHSILPADRLNHMNVANAKSKKIVIHDNVFIGACCLILKGVEIGENSVIAAGSVVTSNVPPNELWGGALSRIKSECYDPL